MQKALLASLVVDVLMGEPRASLHPVVWMGRVLDWLELRAPRREPARLAYGACVAVGLPIAWGTLGWMVDRVAPWPAQALALKATFAGCALLDSAHRVEDALKSERIDDARTELKWLVSRPTDGLDASLVASAAVESLAENFVDSWLAPLMAYSLMGLGGAYAYRAANTADAMWGYHIATYEWLGKPAARLDDLLNWLPARIGALLLVVAGPRPRSALDAWRRDAHLTASPNAGQSMAAAAGQLNVRLEKTGHYVLHAAAAPPSVQQLEAARNLIARVMLLASVLCLALRGKVHP
jgi:adenosylcobinamide-phosphate synthase